MDVGGTFDGLGVIVGTTIFKLFASALIELKAIAQTDRVEARVAQYKFALDRRLVCGDSVARKAGSCQGQPPLNSNIIAYARIWID
jgi:hypothetical protein